MNMTYEIKITYKFVTISIYYDYNTNLNIINTIPTTESLYPYAAYRV